jgi:uncharacterized protein
MRVKLFSHTDHDGVGCAIVGMFAFKDIDIEYCNYGKVDEKITKFIENKEYLNYDYIYITDISIRKETADLINNTQPEDFKDGFMLNEKVQLLDHHATAEWLNENWWCLVQTEENGELTCGTALFYNWLIASGDLEPNEKLRQFVEVVRKYDTWLFSTKYHDDEPKKWNDLLYILGREKFIEYVFERMGESKTLSLDNFALQVLEIEQRKIDEYVKWKDKSIVEKNILGKKVGVVFAESYFSELGDRLATLHPELDLIAMINMNGKISYRTVKNDIDLGKDFASVFGGGGHRKAAGSEFGKEIVDVFVQEVFGGEEL